MDECLLCGAPVGGGLRYCSTGCETADNPYDDEMEEAR